MKPARDPRLIILAVFAVLAIGIVAVILLTRDGDDGSTTAGVEGCEQVEAPPAKKEARLSAPKQTVEKGDSLTAVVETSCGAFEIELDTSRAPKTTNSFAHLAREGFYDDLVFHRIVKGFVIQTGDPTGTGTGGPGYSVDEKPPPNLEYTRGIVAMAKSGADPPGRSSSQFFVVTAAAAPLPPEYALVGRVTEGMDVVDTIDSAGTKDEAGTPKQTVVLEGITIEEG